MIDTKKIEKHIYGIIEALGDDPNREGLKETPQRVAKMYAEVFAGMNQTSKSLRCLTKHSMMTSILPIKKLLSLKILIFLAIVNII